MKRNWPVKDTFIVSRHWAFEANWSANSVRKIVLVGEKLASGEFTDEIHTPFAPKNE